LYKKASIIYKKISRELYLSFEPETAFSALSILKDDASFLLASFLALTKVFSYQV